MTELLLQPVHDPLREAARWLLLFLMAGTALSVAGVMIALWPTKRPENSTEPSTETEDQT